MNKKYLILAGLFFLMALGLVLLPQNKNRNNSAPEKILESLHQPFRYISPEKLAERMIQEDPALMLVDVREAAEFNDFSLPGAVNIPLKMILDPEFKDMLHQEGTDIVFYSNGDIQAENAWILCSRMNIKNLYILKGGLNQWVESIFKPVEPDVSAPAESWAQYDFRKAARDFFLGGSDAAKKGTTEPGSDRPKKVKTAPSHTSHGSEGC